MIKHNGTSQNNVKAQLPVQIQLPLHLLPKSNSKLGNKARAKQRRALEGGKAAVQRKRVGLAWDRGPENLHNSRTSYMPSLNRRKESCLAFPNSQLSKKRQPRRIIPPLEGTGVHDHQQDRSTRAVGNGVLPHGPKTPLCHHRTLVHLGSTSQGNPATKRG